jgi:hypothetical protein
VSNSSAFISNVICRGVCLLPGRLSEARMLKVTRCVSFEIEVKVKQSRYRPGVAQRVPGS